MFASTPDLLRLLAVPVLGWAAWRDVRTRRVPNQTWYPLAALALLLLIWEGTTAIANGNRLFVVQVAISVGFIVPLATAFWYMGSFGGADAKAFYVIAVLFPAYPVFYVTEPATTLPMEPTPIGIFSLTILSNTVLVGAAYPVAVALGNLVRGHVGWPMVVGKPVRWDDVTEEYGVLLQAPDGYTRGGLDLDALRMYLKWRGDSLADLRADPDAYRDPASLPVEPNRPGDGGMATDGGTENEPSDTSPVPDDSEGADGASGDPVVGDAAEDRAASVETASEPQVEGAQEPDPSAVVDDEWGAATFLEDIDHSAYGTTPEQLREGLNVLVTTETVWISPGIPFIVPMFVGLLVSLVYGDVLFSLISGLGLA